MKKLSFTRLIMTLGLCATLAACDGKPEGAGGPPIGAGGPPPAPKVTVTRPLVETVESFKDFSGRFEAKESVEIRARVGGYLQQAPFKDGAYVKTGDRLFVIDPRPYQAALAKAGADVKVAESGIAYKQGQYDRAQALFETGDISAQIRDLRLQERDQAVAELNRAKAAYEQARLDLSYTTITAPISGRIGEKHVTEGNLIAAGQTLLTTIVAVDPIYFYFDIDEQTYLDYARAHPDQKKDALAIPARIALTDENDFRHEGVIDFIDNALDTGTGTMRARVVMENPDFYFTPGMFGRVRVTMGQRENAVLVPDSAILLDQSRKFVYVVDGNNLVSSRAVATGTLDDKGNRVITEGLDGSEQVVVNGLQRVRDGVTVTLETAPQGQAPEGMPR